MSRLTKWLDFNRGRSIALRGRENFLEPFYELQEEFDNLLSSFGRSFSNKHLDLQNLNIVPCADIVEDDKNFKLEIELPGVDENDIKITIDNNVLKIKATKETSRKDEGKDYVMREISYGAYERKIALPDNVDIDNAQSTFKKGMLWVTIPKTSGEHSSARELTVKKAEEN